MGMLLSFSITHKNMNTFFSRNTAAYLGDFRPARVSTWVLRQHSSYATHSVSSLDSGLHGTARQGGFLITTTLVRSPWYELTMRCFSVYKNKNCWACCTTRFHFNLKKTPLFRKPVLKTEEFSLRCKVFKRLQNRVCSRASCYPLLTSVLVLKAAKSKNGKLPWIVL